MRVVLFAFAAIGIGSLAFNLSALLTVGYENKKMPWYIGMVGAILFVMSVFYLATAGLLDSKRMKKVNKDHNYLVYFCFNSADQRLRKRR